MSFETVLTNLLRMSGFKKSFYPARPEEPGEALSKDGCLEGYEWSKE